MPVDKNKSARAQAAANRAKAAAKRKAARTPLPNGLRTPVPIPSINGKPHSTKKQSTGYRAKAQAKRKAAKGYQGPRLPELY